MAAGVCPGYSSSGGTVSTCTVPNVVAGKALSLGTTNIAGAACAGDTYLTLVSPSGTELFSNDDYGGGACSFLSYTPTVSGTYTIKEKCYSTYTCTGTVAYAQSA